MPIEGADSSNEQGSLGSHCYGEKEMKESSWNGRAVHVSRRHNSHVPKMVLCSGTIGGAIKSYFDPEAKKSQEFEINVLMNAIHCSSTEETGEKLKEITKLADQFALSAGLIGIAIFSRDYKTTLQLSAALYFLVKERTFVTLQELKNILKERGKDYEDLHFYSLWEDYQKNQQELRSKGITLDSYHPHYVQNPHYHKPLT
jgi:hypothetical protein